MSAVIQTAGLDRDEAIKRIRAALKARSGKSWSVTGGKGTAWGWIAIDAPPSRRTWRWADTGRKDADGVSVYIEVHCPSYAWGHTGPVERAELASLLGLHAVHDGGVSVAASHGHRQEYVDRAEGREPSVRGERYWD